jgi:Na+/H+ antiporter NhaD/arsenite permease-like protein
MPSLLFGLPFAALVLAIATFPLLPHKLAAWWEHNRNKLLLSVALSLVVLLYYYLRPTGFAAHGESIAPGMDTLKHVLHQSILEDYIPFMVLLFSLYTIAGGIRVAGDIPAHPVTNTVILAIGAVLANLIGTTGASMLLIRPLLQINSERHHTKHTVIFFIFIVSNVAGSLTPIGDPPLFLGYLRGVPFGWTFVKMWPVTLFAVGALLLIYLIWETIEYSRETKKDVAVDESTIIPITFSGMHNLILLVGVVFTVATVIPHHHFMATSLVSKPWVREIVMLMLAAIAYATTRPQIRQDNQFNFGAIAEVAALFLGIFVTMTALTEWLNNSSFAVEKPWHYFWTSGALSSFLDNAPTYAVFFELAKHSTEMMRLHPSQVLALTGGDFISNTLLMAVSAGSVFMGANSYIGNAPNFMVKRIADDAGVKMPSFFGYMAYSIFILVPLFILITLVFFR